MNRHCLVQASGAGAGYFALLYLQVAGLEWIHGGGIYLTQIRVERVTFVKEKGRSVEGGQCHDIFGLYFFPAIDPIWTTDSLLKIFQVWCQFAELLQSEVDGGGGGWMGECHSEGDNGARCGVGGGMPRIHKHGAQRRDNGSL